MGCVSVIVSCTHNIFGEAHVTKWELTFAQSGWWGHASLFIYFSVLWGKCEIVHDIYKKNLTKDNDAFRKLQSWGHTRKEALGSGCFRTDPVPPTIPASS